MSSLKSTIFLISIVLSLRLAISLPANEAAVGADSAPNVRLETVDSPRDSASSGKKIDANVNSVPLRDLIK